MKVTRINKAEAHRTVTFMVEVPYIEVVRYSAPGMEPETAVARFVKERLRTKAKGPRTKWRRKANRRWRALAG